jgi:hypothetical protein
MSLAGTLLAVPDDMPEARAALLSAESPQRIDAE